MRSDRARRRFRARRLRRDLMALVVFLFIFALNGMQGRLEAAGVPQALGPVEPTIPEHDLMLAQRRAEAARRSASLVAREAEEAAADLTAAQRQLARQADAERRRDLERIADLVPPEFRQMVLDLSAQYGVDPRLVAAVGHVESRWNPRTVGTHNDTGLMQILPGTAQWIASRLGWTEYDLFDPWTNLHMGIWYLQALYREYGSWDKALAAYNGGPRQAHLGADHPYVGRVMRVYAAH
ncbi:lytic transglycosylase domain-containing protein [Symbiobacterium thermophilum]|nr:lytic transglycosylase domain-containing protein [Symbiobacterium thermophilum]